ncbi:rho GTPase-activating protein 40 isoform X4 [Petaurus breviceps papuanus]|uniref:rho GTPase-activating protein 40 isoform X4 n=1 Tax=Petaurus breviceps papuanus TaxID=3040969 RepID=UPI0036DBCCB1
MKQDQGSSSPALGLSRGRSLSDLGKRRLLSHLRSEKMEEVGQPWRGFTHTRIPRPQLVWQPVQYRRHWLGSSLVFRNPTFPCSMNQFPAESSSRRQPLEEPNSSWLPSIERLSLDDFWMEVESMKQSDELKQEEGSVTEAQIPEEGEAEAQWLQDTGLADLIGASAPDSDNRVLLSTLTKTQAAAVQRRLDTYTRSIRKKNKPPVRDVRDIFGTFDSGEVLAERVVAEGKWTQLKSRPAESPPENRLFGVPLSTLLETDQKVVPNTQVPLILQALLSCLEKRGLDTEGILRVSGSQTRIKSLEQKLEREFYAGLFNWDEVHQNDASGLLKRFIRELPTPLLTAEYLPAFTVVQNIPDLKQRLQALNLLILILPEANRNTLKALLEFLRKVVAREKNNKMSLWNVSMVIAPNLFMHKGKPHRIPEGKGKQLAEGAADVVRAMIHYQDLLWTVSSFLVAQVRKLNENSSWRHQFYDRRIKNFLRKIHTDKDKVNKTPEEPSKVVKIQAALLLKDCLEVPLHNSTRAADVLKQFQRHLCSNSWNVMKTVNLIQCNGPIESSNLLLYEVGGNISEHCLDPDTYLLDLYHINPHGEWVIKQSPTLPRTL